MTLAGQLDSSVWTPALPLVRTTRWTLKASAVSGRIRRQSVQLAGWTARVHLDAGGLALRDLSSGEEVARVQEVRKHLRTLTTDGQTFDVVTRSTTSPVRVVDHAGRELLSVGLPRWRRRLPLTVDPDLDDTLAVHLAAMVSVVAVRILNGPQTRGAA